MADPEEPPDISDAAKIALALQMMAIADRIIDAAADAPEGMEPSEFADSLTDPAAVAVDSSLANLFSGTHVTNVASIEAAKLRAKLADPKFRAAHPYVMKVTQPDARLSHRVLDGYVMSSEEAQYSPLLGPLGFGCRCQDVPLTVEQARAAGLTGAQPVGDLEAFLASKGVTRSPLPGRGFTTPAGEQVLPGPAPGFIPAFGGTDTQAQLAALRAKAEEIRREDPAAWVELHGWLLWLFLGVDVLVSDPRKQEQSAA